MGSITFKEIHSGKREVLIYIDGQTPPCLKEAPRERTGSRFDKGVVIPNCPLKGKFCFPRRFGDGHIEPGRHDLISIQAAYARAMCALRNIKDPTIISEIKPGTIIYF